MPFRNSEYPTTPISPFLSGRIQNAAGPRPANRGELSLHGQTIAAWASQLPILTAQYPPTAKRNYVSSQNAQLPTTSFGSTLPLSRPTVLWQLVEDRSVKYTEQRNYTSLHFRCQQESDIYICLNSDVTPYRP
jgi:hypothetical protein